MNVLLIGGYRFLGRALIDVARIAGHRITAFNRGLTWPGHLADVELIAGERSADLAKLGGRTWDVVIDTSGYHPRAVRASATALAERAAHYTFVSSISVYPWPMRPGITEDDAVAELRSDEDPDGDEAESYGARKALCEREVATAFDGRSLAIRAGMIVGPYDATERFTYWLERAARGGETIAPGEPSRALQFIDAGDLAHFILAVAERRCTGAVNATGPLAPLTWGAFLQACLAATHSNGRLRWLDDETLVANGFSPGSDFPWWIPSASNGIFETDVTRARDLGLRCRPIEETMRRTWRWLQTLPLEKRPALLEREREASVLA